ncbi:MAG: alkaline phosphatase family protein, partial [Spirochaetaceae bacterium]|nr:alkaline phosphatase family protein [Spirochaetaceae bacterium]
GYEYTPLEINKRDTVPLVEKNNQALLMMPRILSGNGFSVAVTDPPYANYYWISDMSIYNKYTDIKAYITDGAYTDFWMREHNFTLPALSAVIKRNLLWYSVLKGLPLLLRPALYLDGGWLSLVNSSTLRSMLNGYSVLEYLPLLVPVTDTPVNTALIMVNNTTHEDGFLQVPDYRPTLSVTNYGDGPFRKNTVYHTNAAAMKRLAEWFEVLRKEGVYDNTRIILVADHGSKQNVIAKTGLPFNVDHFNPLLMVKDFGASGALKTDRAFMSNADVPSLALRGIVENPVNPFTGNPVAAGAKNKPFYIVIPRIAMPADRQASQLNLYPDKNYYVHTDIFDPANWQKAAGVPAP